MSVPEIRRELKIKNILSRETLVLRQPILRPGKPLAACVFEGDDHATSFHLGAFQGKKLLGVVSLIANNHDRLPSQNQFQLRGMAVLPKYRGKQIAAALLLEAEKKLAKNHVEILWCNAREIAVGFYEKQGFEICGKPFEISEIGKHFFLFKKLEKRPQKKKS